MPRRTDLNHVLVIGSGPILIGQAAEFDYSGTQACRVLRAEGLRVTLINSNPATTDGPVAATKRVLEAGVPLFGICFRNQILRRALDLGTFKLRYGHRGVNHPV